MLKGLKVVSLQDVKDSFGEELDKFRIYLMKNLLGDFNDEAGGDDNFKQTIWNGVYKQLVIIVELGY